MSWAVVGAACGLVLLMAPVLYLVMRWEVRRAFRPVRQELDQLVVQADLLQTRMSRLRQRVEGRDGGAL